MRERLFKYLLPIISFVVLSASLYAQVENCNSCHQEPPAGSGYWH